LDSKSANDTLVIFPLLIRRGVPGKEDYKRGKKKREVKFRKNKVPKPELQDMFKKDISEVEGEARFTKNTVEFKTRYHKKKKLFQLGKEVK